MNKPIVTTFILIVAFLIKLSGQNLTSSDLPIIIINTNNQDIPDEPKIRATMKIIDNGPGKRNAVLDSPTDYDGFIGIELVGETSQGYEKKPYGLELRNENGDGINKSILGLPEEEDYRLISPLNDKTLMRDAITHHFASKVLPWSPRVRYCEVLINGDYKGVYCLIETVKRDKNRVNIKNLSLEDKSSGLITGGYIWRMDKYSNSGGGPGGEVVSNYPPYPGAWQNTFFQYHYPDYDKTNFQQKNYVLNYIRAFESMLFSSDYKNKYRDWIDENSWIDYLLVQELGKNVDGYRLSAYFYKNRDSISNKLFMGPVWDFNIAYGIGDYCDGENYSGWAKDFNQVCSQDWWVIHFWWEKLWQDPTFKLNMAKRWKQHRNTVWSNAKIFGTIDSIATLVNEAKTRNFQRWNVLGEYVWPNAFIGNTYQEEINYLKTWLQNMLTWLDNEMKILSNQNSIPITPFKVYQSGIDEITFENLEENKNYNLKLFDELGRLLKIEIISSTNATIQYHNLRTSALYWIIEDKEKDVQVGKLILIK